MNRKCNLRMLCLFLALLLLTGCAVTYDGPTVEKAVLAEEYTEHYNSDGSILYTTRTEYAYDIYGNTAQVLDYSHASPNGESNPHLKAVMHYDEAGRTLREVQYDLSGWFPEKIIDTRYTYDDQDRMTSRSDHRGWDRWSSTIVYDDENRTRTTTSSDGNVTVEYLNEQGWVMRRESELNGKKTVEEFDRREDGKLLASRSYQDGILISVHEQTYDEQGRTLTFSVTEDGVTTTQYRYEYGEDYMKVTYDFGDYYITSYNPDGTAHSRVHYDADGTMTMLTLCRYTTIRVPAKEETP